MGTPLSRTTTLNWHALGLPWLDLTHLELPFSKQELRDAVTDIHGEKAPGPDGFTGAFYKRCWPTIKGDLLAAVNCVHSLRAQNWRIVNTANLALLPKKDGARDTCDFRPISLMHSVPKILSKMLAARLAPEIHKLVSHNQSAFIRGRSIQDNFLYVQNVIKAAHSENSPLVFLKLDMAKAFDSVSWSYLLEVMEAMGFGQRWRDMVSIIFASSSSRVLLNGSPGAPFVHRRGLRQGDSVSPLLFILAMEPLQRMLTMATERAVLTPLRVRVARLRSGFYVDDAALFINPVAQDFAAVHAILKVFGDASGLWANIAKTVAYPISCSGINIESMWSVFGRILGSFPCQYLGLPIGLRKPRRAEVQPVLDKFAGKLAPRKGRLLNRMGRLVYINSVVTATATFFLTAFPPDKWLIKKMDKLRRNFLWCAEDEAVGRKCLVSWKRVCAPKRLGGLGVKDILCFTRALRLRWEWFWWAEEDRPWKGTATPCDDTDRQLFSSCTSIELGDGSIAAFWTDRWLNGEAPLHLAPDIFKLARFKKLTVKEALSTARWMQGLQRLDSYEQLCQFVGLWEKLQSVNLSYQRDKIKWNITANGRYSACSAYEIQFLARIEQPGIARVWRCKLEGKVKFYMWLLLQNRNWTADRLQARGWPHNDSCRLCDQAPETAAHLTLQCCYARQVWHLALGANGWVQNDGLSTTSVSEWWRIFCTHSGATARIEADLTLAAYIAWHLWKERNRRVFEDKELTPRAVVNLISDDIKLLNEALNPSTTAER
uniref:Reverse transcriptase domain-containing protein n=1 Tax=Aegilops tauschii subsp. strangulata TaxID=200361 RepID=A0A453BYJ9_AEGTS